MIQEIEKKEEAKRAVLYLRYSSESQREESIEAQRRECLEYAKKNGIDVIGEYVDRAKTGRNTDRPGFQRMIAESVFHRFNTVLVWKYDRFSRDRGDSAENKKFLEKNGVTVISATEPNVGGSIGILVQSNVEGVNEFYSVELSEKVRRGIDQNILEGKHHGGHLPFGFKVVDHRYVADEKEAPIVKEIFRLYTEDGLNMKQISEKLTKLGYTRNDGRLINHALVEKILANPKYIGILKSAKFVNDEGCPKLIDKETFDKAQRRRKTLAHVGGAFKKDVCFSLTGKLLCGECGRMVNGDSGTSHTGAMHSYYKCKGRKHKHCDLPTFRKEELEDCIAFAIVSA